MSFMRDRSVSVTLMVCAIGVAVSGGIHLRLYFDGYRNIDIDRVLGINISRSFLLCVITAAIVSELCIAALLSHRGATFASAIAGAYAAGALLAYILTRTIGLLGFEDSKWSTDAVIAKIAEVIVIGAAVQMIRLSVAQRANS